MAKTSECITLGGREGDKDRRKEVGEGQAQAFTPVSSSAFTGIPAGKDTSRLPS